MRQGKFLLAVIGFSALALLTAGISFAERKTDIGQLFADWYNRKLAAAILDINRTFQSETEIQIARYRQELQDRLDRASNELDLVKQEEMRKRLDMLRSYADSLMEGIHAADPEEREQVQAKLDAIMLGAERAMEAYIRNESVSNSTYREPPDFHLQPRLAPVTDTVYNKNLHE